MAIESEELMLFEHIKKRIVKSLIEEILCLDPIELELVGHNIVSIIECKRMIHHGINKDYKPSGYTVDSFTDDSTIVAEYSTEKDYFVDSTPNASPTYGKIFNDITHAISHNKLRKPNKIYLISNQEEPPSFRSKFNTTQIAQSRGNCIIIYDAFLITSWSSRIKNDLIRSLEACINQDKTSYVEAAIAAEMYRLILCGEFRERSLKNLTVWTTISSKTGIVRNMKLSGRVKLAF